MCKPTAVLKRLLAAETFFRSFQASRVSVFPVPGFPFYFFSLCIRRIYLRISAKHLHPPPAYPPTPAGGPGSGRYSFRNEIFYCFSYYFAELIEYAILLNRYSVCKFLAEISHSRPYGRFTHIVIILFTSLRV